MERELTGAEPVDHQQPHGTHRRRRRAGGAEAPCRVILHTDSEYVRNGITRWHTGWVRRNWRNAAGDPVANMDLWRRLLDAAEAAHDRVALGARPRRRRR